MCLIFLWPHPKSGHTMFMDNIPLTLALLLGETAHPLSVAPIAQECREGCSHVDWWIPLKTTWFAWFSFFPPPAPIIIVGDEPLTSPSPSTLPLQCCPHWLKLLLLKSWVLQYNTPHCAEVHMRCKSANAVNGAWDPWRMSQRRSSLLPTTFKCHYGSQHGL